MFSNVINSSVMDNIINNYYNPTIIRKEKEKNPELINYESRRRKED